MGFQHLDQFAVAGGRVASVAPAARVLCTFAIALGAALLPLGAWSWMLAMLAFVLLLATLARIPLPVLLLRSLPPLAFIALASIGVFFFAPDDGAVRFGSALLRGGAAVLASVLLVSTTRFTELVDALRVLRLPHVVTAALGLAFRFLYLLNDELAQLQRAASSRNAERSRRLMLGLGATAVVRSYARSERVHRAMLARGYDGTLRLLHVRPLDAHSWRVVLAVLFVVALIVVGARL